MRKLLLLVGIVTVVCVSCQKQQTEEERKAQIEREVQDRLAAERQAGQQQELNQREADLNAREKSLAEPANPPVSPPRVSERSTVDSANEAEPEASYDLFYTRLEPYGSWLESADYGYVWQPREAASPKWRPYLA